MIVRHDIRRPIAWIAGIAGCGLALVLLCTFVTGVADSGDFGRVMSVAGFRYLDPNESYDDRYFGYAHRYFGYGPYGWGGYISTHVLLLAVAGWVGKIWNGDVFDIRVLGTIYACLWAFAVALIVRWSPPAAGRARTAAIALTLGCALLFVFGDIGYVAYFQSFYGEPFALVGMLLAAGSAIAIASRGKPTGGMLALFVVAGFAVATSKIQHAPVGLAFAVLILRMLPLRSDRRWRRQAVTGAVLLAMSAVLMIALAPDRLKHVNLYQSIFYGVLRDSPDVRRDLEELDIPVKYAVLAGTNYFQHNTAIPQNDPELHREVLSRLSHKDVALYYLRHPSRFADKLRAAAANGAYIRPAYLGNFDRTQGEPRGALSYRFSGWSRWKAAHMPHTVGWFAGCYGLFGAAAAWRWLAVSDRRSRLALETLGVVALIGLFAVVVPLVGDGEADLGKHLFMFNVAFDMMAVSGVTAAVYALTAVVARTGRYERKSRATV